MRAVVISGNLRLLPGQEAAWGALAPLVDRPFSHHVVESVAGQGIREIDFVVRAEDRLTRSTLGDGTRWGARFRYHSHAASSNLYDGLRQVPVERVNEFVLLVHSDRLPIIQLDVEAPATTLFCWRERELLWTGWGVVRAEDLVGIPHGANESELFDYFRENGGQVICSEGSRPLTARSYLDLVEANRRALSREHPGLLFGGREVQPGVWMARNASLHPTAKVAPPAFLGENCRIGEMVQIGPAASIGKDCVIEEETRVIDSVVYRGSYVGRQLALRGVVVDHSRLISTRWGAEIEGVDELLLGSVFGLGFDRRVRRVCRRLGAAAALILCAPLLVFLFAAAAAGIVPRLRKRLIVRTPAVSDFCRWNTFTLWSFGDPVIPAGRTDWGRHFLYVFLPALLPLAVGHLSLAGPRPRTKEEVLQLTEYGRAAYLHSPCGMLQVRHSSAVGPDSDLKSAGMHSGGWRASAGLTRDYAGSVLRSLMSGILPIEVGARRND